MNTTDEKKTYGVFGNTEGRIIQARIENTGATVITLPAPECERLDLDSEDRERLSNLDEFDWVIFTGVFAARYFIEALKAVKTDLSDLDGLRICSAGENVVHYLRAHQVHSDLVLAPRDNDLAAGIEEFAGAELNGIRFLIPTDQTATSDAGAKLKSLGAVVYELPLFRINPVEENDLARLKALILGGAVDELVFSNTDDLLSLQWLFPDEGLSELLKEIGVIAADEGVFQGLVELGLHPRYF